MIKPELFLRDVVIHPEFQPNIIKWLKPWRLKTRIDILIVVDTDISISPVNNFGISSVIKLIRESQVGCMIFSVDIALRSNESFSVTASPSPTQPKYRGFRFNSVVGGNKVLDKYEQVWCFGFKPSNSGSTNDAEIDLPFAMPTSNQELEKLDEWMTEKKGGLFATGDHHFLGASMCRKIPRIGTMRRWTNADGAPPIGGVNRIDTLRPPAPVANYMAGGPSNLGNSSHQGDLTVQPIKWTTWKTSYGPFFFRRKRPHPVLCHPTLGPIDVMPDHAHEGLCVPLPNLSANKQFNSEPEYPAAIDGGTKPKPEIIAYGSNLDSDDWNFAKGEQPGRSNNPMISVYDGHRAGVGRVATDSTWHHWMDVNINAIRAANNNDWKKISRYYLNLAVWLNPPGFSTRCFYLSIVASHFEAVGFQEFSKAAKTPVLGRALREHFITLYGPCWVTERIWEVPLDLKVLKIPELQKINEQFKDLKIDEVEFEELVLGLMVEATMEQADAIKKGSLDNVKQLETPPKLFAKSFLSATKLLQKESDKVIKFEREKIAILKPVVK